MLIAAQFFVYFYCCVVFNFGQDVRELTWEGEPDRIEVAVGTYDSIGHLFVMSVLRVWRLALCILLMLKANSLKLIQTGRLRLLSFRSFLPFNTHTSLPFVGLVKS